MNEQDFIKEFLEKSQILFLEKALYEYHEFSSTHFLKLIPEKAAECEENQLILSELIIAFENRFSGGMLCILGKSSLTKLENSIELISPKVSVQVQTVSSVFTWEQLKQNTFESGEGINPLLITIGVLPQINTQISGIKCFFSETENEYGKFWKVAEPSAKYGMAYEYFENNLNQAA